MKQELTTTSSFLLKWKRQLSLTKDELLKSDSSKSEDVPPPAATQSDWVTPNEFAIADPKSESGNGVSAS